MPNALRDAAVKLVQPASPSPTRRPRGQVVDTAVEIVVTTAGVVGIVLLLLMLIFVVKEALPLLLDPQQRAQASLSRLLLPQAWREGFEPALLWQPTSRVPKVSLIPLFLGTFKVTGIAMFVAAPLGIAAAMYTSEFSPPRLRLPLKSTIELLAGIPSVVLGTFALMTLATLLQDTLGLSSRLNALVAGLAMAVAIVPIIFTLSEDALRSVPAAYREASWALGATRWETTWRVVLPAAMPGVLGALVLGLGRAIGETMIVLMASGNAAIVSASVTEPTRTVAATIAAEMGEAVQGSMHSSLLFLLGVLLFGFNLVLNLTAGSWVRAHMRRRQGVLG